jgi:hypothetical protein
MNYYDLLKLLQSMDSDEMDKPVLVLDTKGGLHEVVYGLKDVRVAPAGTQDPGIAIVLKA